MYKSLNIYKNIIFIFWVKFLYELFFSCCLFCLSIEIYNFKDEKILRISIVFFNI